MTEPLAQRPDRAPSSSEPGRDRAPGGQQGSPPEHLYTVPHADVLAARLEVELSDDLGQPVPDWVVRLADAYRDPRRPDEDSWVVVNVKNPELSWSTLRRGRQPKAEPHRLGPLRAGRLPPSPADVALVALVLAFAGAIVLVVLVLLSWPAQADVSTLLTTGTLIVGTAVALSSAFSVRRTARRADAARRERELNESEFRDRERSLDELLMPRKGAQPGRRESGTGPAR